MVAMKRKVIRPDVLFLPARAKVKLPEHKSSSEMEATLEARRATAREFEPLRAEPNELKLHLLHH